MEESSTPKLRQNRKAGKTTILENKKNQKEGERSIFVESDNVHFGIGHKREISQVGGRQHQ